MRARGIYQWNEHYPGLEQFERDFESGELYVKEENGETIGAVALSLEKDAVYKDVKWLTPDGKNLYVHRLCVHPEQQGRGIARELMDFAESHARDTGCLSARLDTFSRNPRNIRFYENRGYQRLEDVYFPKQSEHPFHCFELVLQSPTFG